MTSLHAEDMRQAALQPTFLEQVNEKLARLRRERYMLSSCDFDITYRKQTGTGVEALYEACKEGESTIALFPEERCRELFADEECLAAEQDLRARGFTVTYRPYAANGYGRIGCDFRVAW